jgi:hypothetical protein
MNIVSLGSRTLIAAIVATVALAPLPVEAQNRHGGGGGYGHGGSYGHGGGYEHGGGYGHGQVYRGGHGGGYWGPGVFLGGLAIGIGLGSYNYGYPAYPGYVVVEPPPVYYPVPVQVLPQPLAAAPAQRDAADPVIYPRNGQSAAQTEADRLECNRWATTLPSAMNDASVFNRATAACMDGHGYSMR